MGRGCFWGLVGEDGLVFDVKEDSLVMSLVMNVEKCYDTAVCFILFRRIAKCCSMV